MHFTISRKLTIVMFFHIVLAKQQAEAARGVFSYNVAVITGEDNVDNFDDAEWRKYLDENEILVMTAQCFCDGVSRRHIKLEQVNVLILDECHHARKGHVFHQIMQHFKDKNMDHCRVIGLSGMLIGVQSTTTKKTVGDEMRLLEATLGSTIISVNNLDDQANSDFHGTKPKEVLEQFTTTLPNSCMMKIYDHLQLLIDQLEPIRLDSTTALNPKTLRPTIPGYIKNITKLYKDIKYQIETMGAYGTYLTLLSVLIQLELLKRASSSEKYRCIIKSGITNIEHFIQIMKLELNIHEKSTATIRQHSSHKIQKLIDYLLKAFTNADREQCLVFCKRRSTAKALYHTLKYYGDYSIKEGAQDFPIKPDFVVGQNNDLPSDVENIISQSFNRNAIEKFTKKETNCIFCTNVLEEGIDLQLCNLVIMYDQPETFRSYMQSRGRARDSNSNYVVFISSGSEAKFNKNLKLWGEIHGEIKEELIGKTIDREEPSEDQVSKQQEHKWEPFITKNGSTLTPLNSITYLNQYVQSIPTDKFTTCCAIDYRRIDIAKKEISVGIKLPIASSLQHEIIGDIQEEVKFAKQHAAYKTIIELYNLGELTDSLTAFDSSQKIELVVNDYFQHWSPYSEDTKKAGTKKNLRLHPIKTPDALANSSPIVKGFNYLYPISVKPKFKANNVDYLKAFEKLIGNGKGYGILASKKLPKLCKIKLFPTYGEVECEIENPPVQISIKTDNELQQLRNFQKTVFRDVLDAWKPFYVIDKTAFVIVPLDEEKEIEWKLVAEFQALSPPKAINKSEARSMKFLPNDYLNKIVTPTYREANKYVVFKVESEQSPLSAFPETAGTLTYKEYFKNKYEITPTDDQQFLIEVKAVSNNWNFLFPGAGDSGENMRSLQKRQNVKEYLIPEFCHNFKFPADFWLKALLLPCILHRVHHLLLAEELRLRLIDEGIDEGKARQNYELDVDYGNYDEREKLITENQTEIQTFGNISEDQFKRALEEAKTNQIKPRNVPGNALINWDNSKLPIDLERNWLAVTQEDIEYFSNFMNENSDGGPKKTYLNPLTRRLAIKDSVYRENITLLGLVAKKCSIQQKDLIKVITTSNAGDVFDMERYETLGDAFLKFITSLFLFKTHDKWHEGHLTALKGRLVSNRNLFYIGNNYGLSKYLKVTKLNDSSFKKNKYVGLAPSTTLPLNIIETLRTDKTLLTQLLNLNDLSLKEVEEGILNADNLRYFSTSYSANVDYDLTPNINEQQIGDKIIADSVEALLGCVISSLGVFPTLKLCGIMKILPNEDGKLDKLLVEKIPPRVLPQYSDEQVTPINNRAKLEKIIGYKFEDERYLIQALTHASYPIKIAGTYEQLEFLGDAVLDFLVRKKFA